MSGRDTDARKKTSKPAVRRSESRTREGSGITCMDAPRPVPKAVLGTRELDGSLWKEHLGPRSPLLPDPAFNQPTHTQSPPCACHAPAFSMGLGQRLTRHLWRAFVVKGGDCSELNVSPRAKSYADTQPPK